MALLQILAGIGYPLLIWAALRHLEPRAIALAILGLVGLRALLLGRERLAKYARATWAPVAAVAVVSGSAAAANSARTLLLGPSLVSFALLAVFAGSLRGEPIIERFARVQAPLLSAAEVAYCRRVTLLWCGFF